MYPVIPQAPCPIKTDNSSAEVIMTDNVKKQMSKAIDIIFYWMKYQLNKSISLYNGNPEEKI